MNRINFAKLRWFEIITILRNALEQNLKGEAFINEIINSLRVLGWLTCGVFIMREEDELKNRYLTLRKRTAYDEIAETSIVISIEREKLFQYMKSNNVNIGINIRDKIEVCCLLSDSDTKETTIWSIPLIYVEKNYDEIGQRLCEILHFNQFKKEICLNKLKDEYAKQQEIIRQKKIIEETFKSPNETIKEILKEKYKAENLNEEVIEEMLAKYTINIGKNQ